MSLSVDRIHYLLQAVQMKMNKKLFEFQDKNHSLCSKNYYLFWRLNWNSFNHFICLNDFGWHFNVWPKEQEADTYLCYKCLIIFGIVCFMCWWLIINWLRIRDKCLRLYNFRGCWLGLSGYSAWPISGLHVFRLRWIPVVIILRWIVCEICFYFRMHRENQTKRKREANKKHMTTMMISKSVPIWTVHRTTYHLCRDRQYLRLHHHTRRSMNYIALGYCTLDCPLHCNSFDYFLEPMVIAKTIPLCMRKKWKQSKKKKQTKRKKRWVSTKNEPNKKKGVENKASWVGIFFGVSSSLKKQNMCSIECHVKSLCLSSRLVFVG